MKLHREGKKIILLYLLFVIVLFLVLNFTLSLLWIKLLIMIPPIVLYGFIIWFFRVPRRPLPQADNKVIAPADGKVVVIEKTNESEYFKDERIQISIFMSPLNVHQNVYPVEGEVTYTKYHPGKYLVAWHPKSSTENERSTLVVRTKQGTEVLFRQIAGAVARRILTYAKQGDKAQKGEEFGFIRFGSRVDIFLPVNTKILCKVGDITQNKITPIAEL